MAVVDGWTGRYLEDFTVGDVYRHGLGRTVTDVDNAWFTMLTLNTNQMHFNQHYAEKSQFGQLLVNSAFTLALVAGMSVDDISRNAMANLGWTDIELPNPVFGGDTLYAESLVTDVRESKSRPNVGIVSVKTRGLNQRGEIVIRFNRTAMVYRRDAPQDKGLFPQTSEPF